MQTSAAALPDTVARIEAAGRITAADVLALRQTVFRDGAADRNEVNMIFRLDRTCRVKDPAWREFYVDTLTDHFVWRTDPPKYVSEDDGRYLIEQIVHDGKVDGLTELELLVNVIHWSVSCPEPLVLLVLQAVRDNVLAPDTALYGHGRKPGVVTATDVEILRRVVYAVGGAGGYTVTQREADLLFDLNDATAQSDNDPSWRDLFVKTIASHLMFPRGAPSPLSATEYKRREAWLEDRRGVGKLLGEVGRNTARLKLMDGFRALDPFGRKAAAERRVREEAAAREACQRESIDAPEARWLLGRISKDGVLHQNEQALLAFIRANATTIDPLLDTLFARAGL